jgi:hypothetical protein
MSIFNQYSITKCKKAPTLTETESLQSKIMRVEYYFTGTIIFGINSLFTQNTFLFYFKIKLKVLPFPISLFTLILLPCASIMCLAIASPSPVPPMTLDRSLSTR